MLADIPDRRADRPDEGLDATAATARRLFLERFGREPQWLAAAPGRVNLIGEHTDYNNGFVLPMAIHRYAVVAGARSLGRSGGAAPRIRVYSAAVDQTVDFLGDVPVLPSEPAWANYLRGVVAGFQRRGLLLPGLDAVIASDVPLGGGLSSSAAVEVAVATLLEVATGTALDPRDKARLCRQAEHEFAGVPCGLMDQLASVFGDPKGALLIDCELESVRVIPFATSDVSVLICNTQVRHALADGAYARRRAECAEAARRLGIPSLRQATPEMVDAAAEVLDTVTFKRARHVVTENARTLAAAQSLEKSEFGVLGALLYASHESLRRDFEVSCAELDLLVDAAAQMGAEKGVFGARMTGGGFGGCTVTLVRSEWVSVVAATLAREYLIRTGRILTSFVSGPARGAHLLSGQGTG